MSVDNLRDLYTHELKDLYSAEKQIQQALPKMAKAAQADELRAGFQEHLAQTEEHVARLEQIFEGLDVTPRGKKCKAMEGLIAEGAEVLKEDPSSVRDAALIAAAQKVEHYEMAGYGTVRTYAQLLGEDEAASLLQQTLDEEGETDHKLTSLAESINVDATAPAGAEGGE